MLETHVPGWRLLRTYEPRWFRRDLLAALALTGLLVPQGMAYAELAGLPAATGLYTTVLALAAYAAFGPSRILILGPDSSLGPLIFATVVGLIGSSGDPDEAIALAGVLALLVGAMALVAGFARLGVIAELFSKPARVGYLNGLAIVIFVSQLPKLFGFSTDTEGLLGEARHFARGLADGRTEPAALAIGGTSLLLLLAARRWLPLFPAVLVAVVAATAVTSLLGLADDIPVVGTLPSGFPSPALPRADLDQLGALAAGALGITFVALVDTMALSESLGGRRGETTDANQELVALGTANVAAGFFRGFPVSASSSRTAVAVSVRAQTQVGGLLAAGAILGLLAAGPDLLADLPTATLAAIVMGAAIALFDFGTLRWLWRVRRSEFLLAAVAMLGVAVFGVLEGIVVAIGLSLANFVRRAWRPHDAVLGRIDQQKGYHDVSRHPEARRIPGLVLFRYDAPLFFANAEHFRRRVLETIDEAPDPVRWVIVSAEPVTDIDTTGGDVLERLTQELAARDITLVFAELKGPVKDRLRQYGLHGRIGERNFHPTVGRAIDAYLDATGVEWVDWTDRRGSS